MEIFGLLGLALRFPKRAQRISDLATHKIDRKSLCAHCTRVHEAISPFVSRRSRKPVKQKDTTPRKTRRDHEPDEPVTSRSIRTMSVSIARMSASMSSNGRGGV